MFDKQREFFLKGELDDARMAFGQFAFLLALAPT